MSFFLKKRVKPSRKSTKRKDPPKLAINGSKRRKDDEVESESDMSVDEEAEAKRLEDLDDEEEVEETPQERKLRLAKKYLEEIEREEKERLETQAVEESLIDKKEQKRLSKRLAVEYLALDSTDSLIYLKNGHKLSVTCVAIAPSSKYLVSGGKEGRLVKWEMPSGKKLISKHESKNGTHETCDGHTSSINSLSFSSDGKFLVSCDCSPVILVWNPEEMQLLHRFLGHRGPVTGVVFRKGTHTLYSCGHDRAVKVWDANENSYVETLFGHQDPITAIDSLVRERALTSGGRDSTVRVWKIPEESQLVFQGNSGYSIDCARFLDEQHFVSGGEEGSISFWGIIRKKPFNVISCAHGRDALSGLPNWISSLACLQNSDYFASGSNDGQVRVWKTDKNCKQVQVVLSVPVKGFVNSLEFSSDGNFLVAGVGQEHRLGRWWKIREERNQVVIIPMNISISKE